MFRILNVNTNIVDYYRIMKDLFPMNITSYAWYKWYHTTLFTTEVRTYGAWDNKKLIGVWSVEPRILNNNNKFYKVGRCFAVGILKEYRKKGLFTELSNFALEQERKIGEYSYIVGFPNQSNPVLKGHLKVGWYPVLEIPKYEYNRVNKFYNINNNIEYRKAENTFIDVLNNRRYTEHPDNKYIIIDGLILKPYKDICHILELGVYPTKNLNVAKKLCQVYKWDKLTVWCSPIDVYKRAIVNSDFKIGNKIRTMIVYNIVEDNNLKMNSCRLDHGIEESF